MPDNRVFRFLIRVTNPEHPLVRFAYFVARYKYWVLGALTTATVTILELIAVFFRRS